MPFHDYYLKLPKFHILPTKTLLAVTLIPLLVALIALVLWLIGMKTIPILGWSSLWTMLGGLALGLFMGFLSVLYALWNGRKPLAPGEYDDLPSVLKAIYMQQKFADFYIAQQGKSDAELYKAFGKFITKHKPADRHQMTQKPGVISSASSKNVIS